MMNTHEIITCPYCHSEMTIGLYSYSDTEKWAYTCLECQARSPFANTFAEADEKAQLTGRHLAPMRYEEVRYSTNPKMYLEKRKSNKPIEMVSVTPSQFRIGVIVETRSNGADFYSCEAYGVMWRCWAFKPTPEDVAAATGTIFPRGERYATGLRPG